MAHRLPPRLLIGLCTALPLSLPAQVKPPAIAVERVAPDLELSRIMVAAAGSDGRICVLDDVEARVHCIRADGTLLWSFGRKGAGPGEWRSVYRMGLAPDNSVMTVGFGSPFVYHVSADGKFVRQARLPRFFGQFGTLVAISRDTIAISGTVASRTEVSPEAIHLFAFHGDSLAHLRSFGVLPEIADPEKQQMAFPGAISLTPRGTLLHARGFPNTVTEYSTAGKLLTQVTSPIATRDPNTETDISRSGSKVMYQTVPAPVGSNRVGTARELRPGQWWLSRSTTGGGQFFDVVELGTKRWLPPKALPKWSAPMGVFAEDRRGGYFVATTTCDDEPCLVRFSSGAYFPKAGP